MFEPRIMAASSLWQPLIFLRNSNLREMNSFLSRNFEPDIDSFRDLWEVDFPMNRIVNRIFGELQRFMRERCLLNRILNRNPF